MNANIGALTRAFRKSPGLQWVAAERAYSLKKWSAKKDDDEITPAGLDEWDRWLSQYFHRARTLGLDNPLGRQALGKYVTTAVAMLESVERVHGDLPAPGRPSGEVS